MFKYITTAVALKCFSCNAATRALYRQFGNWVGNKRRSSEEMPSYYAERLKRMLRLQSQYGIVKSGDRILELGTGWLHWEAVTLRLFEDVEAVLFDVWDNRQLGGLKNYLRQLRRLLNQDFGLSDAQINRAQSLIDEILSVRSHQELYQLLGFQYVVDRQGSLAQFSNDYFQLVVSGGVLEHVSREAIPVLIRETERILRPNGWAIHSIDTADHLEHYDRTVSPKLYLTFSEWTWARLCENQVQYINRLQRGEWLDVFKASGFEIVEEDSRTVDISKLRIAPRFATMRSEDLACTVLRVALHKTNTSRPTFGEKRDSSLVLPNI